MDLGGREEKEWKATDTISLSVRDGMGAYGMGKGLFHWCICGISCHAMYVSIIPRTIPLLTNRAKKAVKRPSDPSIAPAVAVQESLDGTSWDPSNDVNISISTERSNQLSTFYYHCAYMF